MTQLEKMIESCEKFSENIGNTQWNIVHNENRIYKCSLKIIKLYFWLHEYYEIFYCSIGEPKEDGNIKLSATTAQEAATEALELCRKEAQKLVELLGEPTDENHEEHF